MWGGRESIACATPIFTLAADSARAPRYLCAWTQKTKLDENKLTVLPSSLIYTTVRESLEKAPDWVSCARVPTETRAAAGWGRDEQTKEKWRNDLEEVRPTHMIYKTPCIIDKRDVSCRGSSLMAIISGNI